MDHRVRIAIRLMSLRKLVQRYNGLSYHDIEKTSNSLMEHFNIIAEAFELVDSSKPWCSKQVYMDSSGD